MPKQIIRVNKIDRAMLLENGSFMIVAEGQELLITADITLRNASVHFQCNQSITFDSCALNATGINPDTNTAATILFDTSIVTFLGTKACAPICQLQGVTQFNVLAKKISYNLNVKHKSIKVAVGNGHFEAHHTNINFDQSMSAAAAVDAEAGGQQTDLPSDFS